MKSALLAAALGVVTALLVGCQTQQQQQGQYPEVEQRVVAADGEDLIGERADPRTRAKAHADLAVAYYGRGNMGIALEEAKIALAADPTYPPAHNIQGLIYMDLRDNAAAEASFQRGLQIAPQDADLNHNYGWFLCRTGREDQSTQWFFKAIKNPFYQTPARSYVAAARCVQSRTPAEAVEFYDRALQLEPNNTGALLSYADLRYQQSQLAEAKLLLMRYNKLVQQPPAEALWLGVRVERKLGDRAAEASYTTQLRRRFPNSVQYQSLQRGVFD